MQGLSVLVLATKLDIDVDLAHKLLVIAQANRQLVNGWHRSESDIAETKEAIKSLNYMAESL